MAPENAGLISVHACYANSITVSAPCMWADTKDMPEILIPEEQKDSGKFLPVCSSKSNAYYIAIRNTSRELSVASEDCRL